MDKKSFMDNAKGFLSSWKKDYNNKNSDVIDRKKKRDEEAEKMKQEMLKTFDEIKTDLKSKSAEAMMVLSKEFSGFMDAVKKGTVSLQEKAQLEKHLSKAKNFLLKLEVKGAEKLDTINKNIQKNVSEHKTVLKDETELVPKHDEFDEIIQQAEDELDKMENIKK